MELTPQLSRILGNRAGISDFQREEEEFQLRKQKALLEAQNQGQDPAAIREWNAYNAMTPEDQQRFLQMKRADQVMNLGGTLAVRNPTGGLSEVYQVTPKPDQMPDFRARVAGEEQDARNQSDFNADLYRDQYSKNDPTFKREPLPASVLTEQQDTLEKIGLTQGLNADLAAIRKDIESGTLKLGPVQNLTSKGLNLAGRSNETSRAYQSLVSTLEKQRNESLRLNNGVQTEGDAQRAWNELIANLNDPKFVAERLQEIEGYNERATQIHKLNIDMMRQNYKYDPLNYDELFQVQPAYGAGRTTELDPVIQAHGDAVARQNELYPETASPMATQDDLYSRSEADFQKRKAQANAPKADIRNIPMSAVQELKADPSPEASAEFDEVFGAGAAAQIIGKGGKR